MAESHKRSKQTVNKTEKSEETGKSENSDKGKSSGIMPTYDVNEEWVQDHIKKNGEEPGFF